MRISMFLAGLVVMGLAGPASAGETTPAKPMVLTLKVFDGSKLLTTAKMRYAGNGEAATYEHIEPLRYRKSTEKAHGAERATVTMGMIEAGTRIQALPTRVDDGLRLDLDVHVTEVLNVEPFSASGSGDDTIDLVERQVRSLDTRLPMKRGADGVWSYRGTQPGDLRVEAMIVDAI